MAANAIRADLVHPFVSATLDVFRSRFATELQYGQAHLRRTEETSGGLSGLIGLSGTAVGTVAITVDHPSAVKFAERYTGDEIDSVDNDVVDCIGDLINLIAQDARHRMQDQSLSVSMPSIIRGEDHRIQFPSGVVPICIPFTCDVGGIMIQVGLRESE